MIFRTPLAPDYSWAGKHRKSFSTFRLSSEHFSFAKSGHKILQIQSLATRTGPRIQPF